MLGDVATTCFLCTRESQIPCHPVYSLRQPYKADKVVKIICTTTRTQQQLIKQSSHLLKSFHSLFLFLRLNLFIVSMYCVFSIRYQSIYALSVPIYE